jgi:hypothetical protein
VETDPHISSGTTHSTGVPGRPEPTVGALAFAAVAMGGFSLPESERRATRDFKRETRGL